MRPRPVVFDTSIYIPYLRREAYRDLVLYRKRGLEEFLKAHNCQGGSARGRG